ncbi:MAG TPA: hypothetical protein VM261_13320 [Kofleriaceae bacterium]|nr:hypothetical protein [Kofleriaceae bacterium]
MRPSDTTPDAYQVQLAALRRMSLDERILRTLEMMDEGYELARDGIRMRHPDYSERQVFLALVRMLHGDELYAKAWPGEARLAP